MNGFVLDTKHYLKGILLRLVSACDQIDYYVRVTTEAQQARIFLSEEWSKIFAESFTKKILDFQISESFHYKPNSRDVGCLNAIMTPLPSLWIHA
jgi:hypothetical protein